MGESNKLATLRRQVAPPAFTNYRAPMTLAALRRQVAPPAFTDYWASMTGHLPIIEHSKTLQDTK